MRFEALWFGLALLVLLGIARPENADVAKNAHVSKKQADPVAPSKLTQLIHYKSPRAICSTIGNKLRKKILSMSRESPSPPIARGWPYAINTRSALRMWERGKS